MARNVAAAIAQAFYEGRLDWTDRPRPSGLAADGRAAWKGMPEVRVAESLRERGWDDARVRGLLTFVCAMDRARDADRLWDAAAEAALSPEDAWVFDAERVAAGRLTDLADVLRARKITQRHGPDIAAWRTIAESLVDPLAPDAVRCAVRDGRGDARALLDGLAVVSPRGSPRFPFLGGPKVGPMWVRILVAPGGAQFERMETIPVAVDVQVRKVTEYLRVAETAGKDLTSEVREEIQDRWRALVAQDPFCGPEGIPGTCAALDPALWFFAKWGCTHCERKRRRLPFSPEACAVCRFDGTPAKSGDCSYSPQPSMFTRTRRGRRGPGHSTGKGGEN